jgi:two-component system CheB/CheR fusion protein
MPLGQSWTYRGVPFGARIQPELVPVADHTQPRKKGSKRPATAAAVADDRPGDGAASAGSGPATHDESVDGRPAAGETSEATPGSAARATPFPVVGIGASAGGLAAFEAFFAATAAGDETGMAFVLVQHLSPDHKSMLVDLVKRCTRMQVFEASNGMVVQPNCTYIIPPNHDLELVQGVLLIKQHDRQRKPRLTIDHFFTSLAAAQGERAICVVMSGTGNDGTLGLRDVKGEGGLVIAQDPDSAEYDGMPRSAIATGMVDYVLTPAAMPGQLLRYVRHAFDAARPLATSATRDGFLKKLCVLLRAQTGHDFSQYKETTLLRRMERRMALHQIAQAEDYLRLARDNAQELEALFRDLLIGVTNFFRDPTAFKVLEETVIPRMLSERALQDPLRVWVCGCSTGEEAYSIAILLHERMLATKRTQKVQLFATDIDRQAIEQARDGVYPASIAANVSEQRLGLYFTHDPQRATYRIQKHLRDLVVFSEQDVIKDPPFSRLDLVSCRNLLIYLNPDLQRRLEDLHAARRRQAGAAGGAARFDPATVAGARTARGSRGGRLARRLSEPTPADRARTAGAFEQGRCDGRCARPHPAHRRPHRQVPRARRRRCVDEHSRDGARRPAPRADRCAAPGGRSPGAGVVWGLVGQGQRRAHQGQPRGAADRTGGRRSQLPGGARGSAGTARHRAGASRRARR